MPHNMGHKTISDVVIPCSLWPVVPSFEFAGIWFILHWIWSFLKYVQKCFTVTSGEKFLVQGWIFDYFFLLITFLLVAQVCFCSGVCHVFFSNSCICASSCTMYPGLLPCLHSIHSTSFALTVQPFFHVNSSTYMLLHLSSV